MSQAIVIILLIISILPSFCSRHFNLPKFCPNLTWDSDGSIYPQKSRDVPQPRSIFVDIKDTVYVSYGKEGFAIVWPNETLEPSQVYDSKEARVDSASISSFWSSIASLLENAAEAIWSCLSTFNCFSGPSDKTLVPLNISNSVFVTSNGNIYIGDSENRNINRWSGDGILISIALEIYSPCYGLFIDVKDTLYCSSRERHTVIKKPSSDQNHGWRVAAGTDRSGSDSNALSYPFGIFVNDNLDLYVADWGNNRIQLFRIGQSSADTVPNDIVTIGGKSLKHPTSVILDADNNLYIVDSENHRIVSVTADFKQHRCLIGCSGTPGSGMHQLKVPTGISFDSFGNILITDSNNDRVMRFRHPTQSCSQPQTTTTTTAEYPDRIKTTPTKTTVETPNMESTNFETVSNAFTDTSATNEPDALTTSSSIDKSSETSIENKETVTESSEAITSTESDFKTTAKGLHDTSLTSSYFVPNDCPDSNYIGSDCNVSMNVCDLLQPCKDRDSCRHDPTQVNGHMCALNVEPCQSNPCLNDGTCISLNATNFHCNCTKYRTGTHCEFWIDYCHNITCFNKGRCRSVPPGYVCDCIASSFSGRHCEKVARHIVVRQYVSTTFGYAGIIALCTVAGFVVIMDILKYGFGIDPVQAERDLLTQQRLRSKRKEREKDLLKESKY